MRFLPTNKRDFRIRQTYLPSYRNLDQKVPDPRKDNVESTLLMPSKKGWSSCKLGGPSSWLHTHQVGELFHPQVRVAGVGGQRPRALSQGSSLHRGYDPHCSRLCSCQKIHCSLYRAHPSESTIFPAATRLISVNKMCVERIGAGSPRSRCMPPSSFLFFCCWLSCSHDRQTSVLVPG